MLRLGHAVGRVLQGRDAAADGADRQGHAHLGLHDRVGAGGRLRLGRRRRAAHRPAADAGRGLPDARAAAGPGRASSAPRTTRSRTTASSSSRRAGEKLPDAWEQAVEAALDEPPPWVDSAALGKARRLDDARGPLHRVLQEHRRADLSLKGMKIVVDAAHGAAYHVAPDVFHELGAEVVAIGCAPDGININDGFGATAPAGAGRRRCASTSADYGIALDGDADRLQLVDAQRAALQRRRAALRDGGRPPRRRASGAGRGRHADDQHGGRAGAAGARRRRSCAPRSATATCSRSWRARGWLLGGEGSGHLLALDKHTTGDGIVSALQVLQAVRAQRPYAGASC